MYILSEIRCQFTNAHTCGQSCSPEQMTGNRYFVGVVWIAAADKPSEEGQVTRVHPTLGIPSRRVALGPAYVKQEDCRGIRYRAYSRKITLRRPLLTVNAPLPA